MSTDVERRVRHEIFNPVSRPDWRVEFYWPRVIDPIHLARGHVEGDASETAVANETRVSTFEPSRLARRIAC